MSICLAYLSTHKQQDTAHRRTAPPRHVVALGNGGPRWLRRAHAPRGPGHDLIMPLTQNGMVQAALAGIRPGTYGYHLQAEGPSATRMLRGTEAATQILRVQAGKSGRLRLQDARDACLTFQTDANAWQTLSLKGPATAMLRILTAALPRLPVAWLDELWWSDSVPASRLRPGLAGWLRRLRTTSHYETPAPGQITVTTRLRTLRDGLPLSVAARIDPALGIAEIAADFIDGRLRFVQSSAMPAQLDSPTP